MPRGGRRPGAGRRRGSKDRYDKTIAAAAAETGQTPLDIMLEVARTAMLPGRRSKVSPQLQLYAAKEAAAYCHAKLQAIAITTPRQPGEGKTWDEMTSEERLDLGRRMAYLLRRAEHELDAQEAPKPAQPLALPHWPQPEIERPKPPERPPLNEHAVELLGRPFPIETWSRLAGVDYFRLPDHLKPELLFDVRGSRPVPMIQEEPRRWRERVVAMGFSVEAPA